MYRCNERSARSRKQAARPTSWLRVAPLVAGLTVGAFAQGAWSQEPFSEDRLFFELNNTDKDLGLHAIIDGPAYDELEIRNPDGLVILHTMLDGSFADQGLTEFRFESAEPRFSDLPPAEFFLRFPEGIYTISGFSGGVKILESLTEVTQAMPEPARPTVNGQRIGEICDSDDPGFDAPEVSAPVTVAWPKVRKSHPDDEGGGAGIQPPIKVDIVNYEVAAEVDHMVGPEEFSTVFDIVLSPRQRSVTLPAEFIALGDEFKLEVLAREESGNQTAVESCFVVE